jgi:arylsulfatase
MNNDDARNNTANLNRRNILLGSTTLAAAAALGSGAFAQAQKAAPSAPAQAASSPAKLPNILFIMGDDIGWFNVSAYNMGVMG